MGFSDNFPGVHERVFEQLSTLGEYNNGTDTVDLKILFDSTAKIPGVNGQTGTAYVLADDIPNPEYRQSLIIDGVTWKIFQNGQIGPVLRTSGIWEVPVNRDERFKGRK